MPGGALLRNLFDQYSQLENRLTNALIQVLSRDQDLARDFITTFLGSPPPRGADLFYSCLHLPDDRAAKGHIPSEGLERLGFPDAWVYTEDRSWVAVLENKVTAGLSPDQLQGHLATTRRRGAQGAKVLVITAHESRPPLLKEPGWRGVSWTSWPEVYKFLAEHANSWLHHEFLSYVRIVEAQLVAEGHDIPPLTRFDGITFGPDHPFDPLEAKAMLRALLKELRRTLADEAKVPINPHIKRGTIPATGTVWDVIGFGFAPSGDSFYMHPHLSIGISRDEATISLILPHSAEVSYWEPLRRASEPRLSELMTQLLEEVRPLRKDLGGGRTEPEVVLETYQRHFHARREGIVDGRIRFAIDAVLPRPRKVNLHVKTVPVWLSAFRLVLESAREANFEVLVKVGFPLSNGSASRESRLIQHMARAAEALYPVALFLRGKR